jgi:putative transposase
MLHPLDNNATIYISLSLIIYYEKNIIERRTIQYIKDRTESFDDYFPCGKEKCMLEHIRNWFNLFVDHHTKEVMD